MANLNAALAMCSDEAERAVMTDMWSTATDATGQAEHPTRAAILLAQMRTGDRQCAVKCERILRARGHR